MRDARGTAAALQQCVKRQPSHLRKIDVHSLSFQTALELAAGGVFTALLLRWLM